MDQKSHFTMKSVTFNEKKNKVYNMVVWSFAYKEARRGDYQKMWVDQCRFEKRIKMCEKSISKILDCNHRYKMYNYIMSFK